MSDPESKKFYCNCCKTERMFSREKVNHRLHIVLSLLTGGLWLISWLALYIGQRFELWTCSSCDHQQESPAEAPPKW